MKNFEFLKNRLGPCVCVCGRRRRNEVIFFRACLISTTRGEAPVLRYSSCTHDQSSGQCEKLFSLRENESSGKKLHSESYFFRYIHVNFVEIAETFRCTRYGVNQKISNLGFLHFAYITPICIL